MPTGFPEDVVLNGDGGIPIVVPTFGVSLYCAQPFSRTPQELLHVFDRYCGIVKPGAFHWYASENMNQHKRVTTKSLDLLRTWLKPGAPPRESITLELKGGSDFNAAADVRFTVIGGEPGSVDFESEASNVISMAFPLSEVSQHPDQMQAFFLDCCNTLPFLSALAGFSCEWSRYAQVTAHPHAWAKSMRYQGMDIAWPSLERFATRRDAVRAVNWLTALSQEFVDRLGGLKELRSKLGPSVSVTAATHGVVLQAGALPNACDVNDPHVNSEYSKVFHSLLPLIEPCISRYPTFSLRSDRRDQTTAWLMRLRHEP